MPSPVQTIRAFCLTCVGGSKKAVRECSAECPLHPFRMGTNPNRAGIGGKRGVTPAKISKKKAAQVRKSTHAIDAGAVERGNGQGTAAPAIQSEKLIRAAEAFLREIRPEVNP